MRSRLVAVISLLVLVAFCGLATAADTEQDMVNKFLKKTETKHIRKLGWISGQFTVNRINRDNEYNSFATHVNSQMTGGKISWLDNSKAIGMEFGTMVQKKIAWSVGGEYWLKFGSSISGSVNYVPTSGTPTTLTNAESKMTTMGFYTSASYYLKNAPAPGQALKGVSLYVGGTAGYYQLSWDVFPQYQNLNLSTATPDGSNTTFKGSAPGFSIHAGAEYPLRVAGLTLSGEASYLFLNFTNVSWYNSLNQEVVATYGETPDTRVDVSLSGARAKMTLKKYFSW